MAGAESLIYLLFRSNARSLKADKKRARRDEGGDVTYINEKNKVFNKKINRYFDKYTSE